MKQTLTAKLKIVPSAEEAALLADTMRAYSSACNYVAKYIFDTHDLVQASLNKALYHELRSRFCLRSQMAQSVMKTVIARYRTILANQHQWIKPVFKRPELDLVWNRDYSLKGELFSVNTLEGRIKVSFFAKGVDIDGEFGTAKLVYRHGKFFLHVPVTNEIDELSLSDVSNVVGVDRGIRFLAATYDSEGERILLRQDRQGKASSL